MKTAEQELERLYLELPAIKCKGLCQECCGPISMTQLEISRIAQLVPSFPSLAREMPVRLASGQVVIASGFVTDCEKCPLLTADGRCSVYPIRPLICRLWGLVQAMRCPFGCTPERWVSPRESFKLLSRADQISRKAARP
jgi:hypothetical protein